MSLNQIADEIVKSNGITRTVYQDVFTSKILNNEGFIEINTLRGVLELLPLDQLLKIACAPNMGLVTQLAGEKVNSVGSTETIISAFDQVDPEHILRLFFTEEKRTISDLARKYADLRLFNVDCELLKELNEKNLLDKKEEEKNGNKRKQKTKSIKS